MNDYLEYLEEQQKYQAVENTIHHSTDGQKEQLAQLRALCKGMAETLPEADDRFG